MTEIPESVRAFHERLLRGGGVIVAVSGGADSVALWSMLADLPPTPGVRLIADVNHQLRGDASDADEDFVRSLTAPGWTTITTRLPIAAAGNLEARARQVRYDWLTALAHSHGAAWVATAHTADDQAETVLMRLLRGSGWTGLRGIAAQRPLRSTVTLVRPVLSVRCAVLRAYLSDRGRTWRHDASNDDGRWTRNRIRHELLPMLIRDYNPRTVDALTRWAEQASEVGEWLSRQAEALRARAERPRVGSTVVLEAAVLLTAEPLLRREVLRRIWQREGWPARQMSSAHWRRLAQRLERPGRSDFPGGVSVRRRGGVVTLQRTGEPLA